MSRIGVTSLIGTLALMNIGGLVAVSDEEQERRDKTPPPPPAPPPPKQIGPENRQARRARERREAKRKPQ